MSLAPSRRHAALAVLFGLGLGLGAPAALATGFGGSDAPSRIPVPGQVFRAAVEDRSGAKVTVDRVTFNGEVHIYGQLGEGQVAVPFERIDTLRVEPGPDDGHVVLFLTLKQGEPLRLVVEDDVPCYGSAPFGNYKIEVGRIRIATFEGPLDAPRE